MDGGACRVGSDILAKNEYVEWARYTSTCWIAIGDFAIGEGGIVAGEAGTRQRGGVGEGGRDGVQGVGSVWGE